VTLTTLVPIIAAVLAAVASGVNTAVVVRLVFRAGVWFGQVNTRLDAGDETHRDIVARLGRLEALAIQRER
jgi:hypothetical protein